MFDDGSHVYPTGLNSSAPFKRCEVCNIQIPKSSFFDLCKNCKARSDQEIANYKVPPDPDRKSDPQDISPFYAPIVIEQLRTRATLKGIIASIDPSLPDFILLQPPAGMLKATKQSVLQELALNHDNKNHFLYSDMSPDAELVDFKSGITLFIPHNTPLPMVDNILAKVNCRILFDPKWRPQSLKPSLTPAGLFSRAKPRSFTLRIINPHSDPLIDVLVEDSKISLFFDSCLGARAKHLFKKILAVRYSLHNVTAAPDLTPALRAAQQNFYGDGANFFGGGFK